MNNEEPTKFGDIDDEPIEDYFDGIEHTALKKPKKMPRFGLSSITEIPLIIAGIGLVVLIILLAVLIPGNEAPSESVYISRIDEKIQQMEARLSRIEKAMQKPTDRKDHDREADVDMVRRRVSSLESDILSRFDNIEKKLDQYQNQLNSIEKPIPVKRRDAGLGKSSKSSQKSSAEVYHHVKAGETLYGIGRKYSLSVGQLQKLNPSIKGKNIFPGQKLRIK